MPYEWIGEGVTGIPGVPARELTDDEAEAFGVTDSPYYREVTQERESVSEDVAEEGTDGQRD